MERSEKNKQRTLRVTRLAIFLRKQLWVYLSKYKPDFSRKCDSTFATISEPKNQYYERLLDYLWERYKNNILSITPRDRGLLAHLYTPDDIDNCLRESGKLAHSQLLGEDVLLKLFQEKGINHPDLKRFLRSKEIKGHSKAFVLLIGVLPSPEPIEVYEARMPEKDRSLSFSEMQVIDGDLKKPRLLTKTNLSRMEKIRVYHPMREWIDLRQDDLYVARKDEQRIIDYVTDRAAQMQGGFSLIYGEAGTGKTTLLWKLYEHLQSSPIPLEVHLWQALDISLGIDNGGGIMGRQEIKKLLSALDGRKPLVILLDTLDVRLHSEREKIDLLLDLQQLLEMGIIVIGTSRSEEADQFYSFLKQPQFVFGTSSKIGDFDDMEMRAAVKKHAHCFWKIKSEVSHENPDGAVREILSIVSRSQSMEKICRRPLTLRMLFTLYFPNRIPPLVNVIELYRDYWNKMVANDRRVGDGENEIETKRSLEAAAMHIASKMLIEGRPRLVGKLVPHELKSWEVSRGDVKLLASRGIITYDEPLERIEFFHQTFFEFSAARAVVHLESRQRAGTIKGVLDVFWDDLNTKDLNLFLLPILENTLILAEDEAEPVVRNGARICADMLRHSNKTFQRSGVFIYQHLHIPSLELKTCILELLESGKGPLVEYYLKIASCIIYKDRAIQLLTELDFLYRYHREYLQIENFYLLLRSIALLAPENVTEFVSALEIFGLSVKPALLESKGQSQKGITLPHAAHYFIDVLSLCIHRKPNFWIPIIQEILQIANKEKRRPNKEDSPFGIPNAGKTVSAHLLLTLYYYGGLGASPVLLAELIETLLSHFDAEVGKKGKIHAGIPLFEFGLLWSLQWSHSRTRLDKIIVEMQDDSQVASISKISGLFHLLVVGNYSLDEPELEVLWEGFYAKGNRSQRFFDWQEYFWQPLFEMHSSTMNVELLRKLILKRIETALRAIFDVQYNQWAKEWKGAVSEPRLEDFTKFLNKWNLPLEEMNKLAGIVSEDNWMAWIERPYLSHLLATAVAAKISGAIKSVSFLRDHYEPSYKDVAEKFLIGITAQNDNTRLDQRLKVLVLEVALQLQNSRLIAKALSNLPQLKLSDFQKSGEALSGLLNWLYAKGEFRYRFEIHYHLCRLGLAMPPDVESFQEFYSKSWEYHDFEWLSELAFKLMELEPKFRTKLEEMLIGVAQKFNSHQKQGDFLKKRLLLMWEADNQIHAFPDIAMDWLLQSFRANKLENWQVIILYHLSSLKRSGSTMLWFEWMRSLLFSDALAALGNDSQIDLTFSLRRIFKDLLNRLIDEEEEEMLEKAMKWVNDLPRNLRGLIVNATFSDPTLRVRARRLIGEVSELLKEKNDSTSFAIELRQQGFERANGSEGWRSLGEISKKILSGE